MSHRRALLAAAILSGIRSIAGPVTSDRPMDRDIAALVQIITAQGLDIS